MCVCVISGGTICQALLCRAVGAAGVSRTNEQRGGYHGWAKERRVRDHRWGGGLVKGPPTAQLKGFPSRRSMGEFDVL